MEHAATRAKKRWTRRRRREMGRKTVFKKQVQNEEQPEEFAESCCFWYCSMVEPKGKRDR